MAPLAARRARLARGGELLVGRGARRRRGARVLFLGGVAGLVSRGLVERGERVAEAVAEVGRAAVLLLEDGVLDDGGPDGAVLVVAGLERAVLLLGERAALLGARFFEDGGAVGEGGADLGGEVCFGIGVVLFICVGEVGAEPVRTREPVFPVILLLVYDAPVFEIDGRAVIKVERGVVQDRLPVADAMLIPKADNKQHHSPGVRHGARAKKKRESGEREERRGGLTRLQPSTSMCVSSIVHFLRAFFSGGGGGGEGERAAARELSPLASLRIFPRGSWGARGSRPVSSRKVQAGTWRGEDGRARETRRCLCRAAAVADAAVDEVGKGAVNENVDDGGAFGCLDIAADAVCEGECVDGTGDGGERRTSRAVAVLITTCAPGLEKGNDTRKQHGCVCVCVCVASRGEEGRGGAVEELSGNGQV